MNDAPAPETDAAPHGGGRSPRGRRPGRAMRAMALGLVCLALMAPAFPKGVPTPPAESPSAATVPAPAVQAARVPAPAVQAAAASSASARVYVGEKVCVICHARESNNFAHTTHAKLFRLNPKSETEKQVCEACHGPGSRHVQNTSDHDGLISFARAWGTSVARQNQQCMTCHAGGQRIH